MNGFKISVIICTKNRAEDLKDCIDSLYAQTVMPDEIIIVDCSDRNNTSRLIRKEQLNKQIPIKYIHTKPGLTRQRNLGISMSMGNIISFLDDDVILDEKYLLEIINCFRLSEKIDSVGGLITNVKKDATAIRLFKKLFMLQSNDYRSGIMKRSGFAVFPFAENKTEICMSQVLSGCSCSFRREVFDNYQFDEYFDGYGLMEDVEFTYRVSKKRKVIYTPYAKLIHKRSEIDRDNISKLFQMRILNHFYVFRKLVYEKSSDWLYFWWSHVGINITTIFCSLKFRSLAPIIGVITEYRMLYQRSLGHD